MAASSGLIGPMRWYMRIGSAIVRCGSVAGRVSSWRSTTGSTCRPLARGTATAPEQTSSATARKVARLDIEENDDSLLQGMRGVACIAVACAGFLAAGSAPAAPTRMLPVQLQARVAVKRAVKSGWIDNATAARSRAAIDRAAGLIRRLPGERAEPVDVAL